MLLTMSNLHISEKLSSHFFKDRNEKHYKEIHAARKSYTFSLAVCISLLLFVTYYTIKKAVRLNPLAFISNSNRK